MYMLSSKHSSSVTHAEFAKHSETVTYKPSVHEHSETQRTGMALGLERWRQQKSAVGLGLLIEPRSQPLDACSAVIAALAQP